MGFAIDDNVSAHACSFVRTLLLNTTAYIGASSLAEARGGNFKRGSTSERRS